MQDSVTDPVKVLKVQRGGGRTLKVGIPKKIVELLHVNKGDEVLAFLNTNDESWSYRKRRGAEQ